MRRRRFSYVTKYTTVAGTASTIVGLSPLHRDSGPSLRVIFTIASYNQKRTLSPFIHLNQVGIKSASMELKLYSGYCFYDTFSVRICMLLSLVHHSNKQQAADMKKESVHSPLTNKTLPVIHVFLLKFSPQMKVSSNNFTVTLFLYYCVWLKKNFTIWTCTTADEFQSCSHLLYRGQRKKTHGWWGVNAGGFPLSVYCFTPPCPMSTSQKVWGRLSQGYHYQHFCEQKIGKYPGMR